MRWLARDMRRIADHIEVWCDRRDAELGDLDIVGTYEIALRVKDPVGQSAVTNWAARWSDWPKVAVVLGGTRGWHWHQVEEVLRAHDVEVRPPDRPL